jgi:hypothetical protein
VPETNIDPGRSDLRLADERCRFSKLQMVHVGGIAGPIKF